MLNYNYNITLGDRAIEKGRSSMDEKIKMEKLTSCIWQGFNNLAVSFFTASTQDQSR